MNYPLHIALYQPRIPQNTGNIARTCAAFKLPLYLIQPLGFSLEDRYLKRAGLDYWPLVDLKLCSGYSVFKAEMSNNSRLIACSKYGGVKLNDFEFKFGDTILFGREDNGLPDNIRKECREIITIPMPGGQRTDSITGVRSLNLSVACAIISYQAVVALKLI